MHKIPALPVAALTALMLIGAGCVGSGTATNTAATTPTVNKPTASPEISAALVLTEGQTAPADADLGPTIGCNDRIIYVNLPRPTQSKGDLIDALTALLGVKEQFYRGEYSGLWQSSLAVDSVTTAGGTTTVALTGQVQSGGICDDPRIKEQVAKTIERHLTGPYVVTLNGMESAWRCVGDLKGDCK